MEKYQKIKELGRGSYGVVWKSLNKTTNEVVAIKKIKTMYLSSKQTINLTDVKSLLKMNHHPNIVKLKEIIKENDKSCFFLVYEYMECSLYKRMMERKKGFSETEVKNLCFQVFKGLAYMHCNGFFHNDLKPDSFLVNGNNVVKICDVGHSREMNGNSPGTNYVTRSWYRPPEAILDLDGCGYAVDMWAMGAIMVELFTLEPVFKGFCETEVLFKICSMLGSPKDEDIASDVGFLFPEVTGVAFSELLPCVSADVVDLIGKLLSWRPSDRPTAMEALKHPFFDSCY